MTRRSRLQLDRGKIRTGSCIGAQSRHPILQRALSLGDQCDVFGLRCLALSEPTVECLLKGPRHFAKLEQTDHPARSLERVKTPTNGRERLDVVRRQLEHDALSLDGSQHILGFIEKDIEQLGVDGWRNLNRLVDGHHRSLCRFPMWRQPSSEARVAMTEAETAAACVGTAQRLDEKAEGAEIVCHAFKCLSIRNILGLGELSHPLCHFIGAACGLMMAQQTQGTTDLTQTRADRLQRIALLRVTKESVERPFAVFQIDLQFGDERTRRQPLLRGARQLAQPCRHGRMLLVRAGIARDRLQSASKLHRPSVVVARGTRPLINSQLNKQQRTGHVQRQSLDASRIAIGQRAAQTGDRATEFAHAGHRQSAERHIELLGTAREPRQIACTRTHETLPGRFGVRRGLASQTQTARIEQAITRDFEVGRHRPGKPEQLARLIRLGTPGTASGQQKQQFGRHAAGDRRERTHIAAQMLLQPRHLALGIQVRAQGTRAQRVNERSRQPPVAL